MLITPGAHASIVKLFEQHATLPRAEFVALREGVDFCGENVELPQAEVIDGIMHIPISGPIGQGLGAFEKGAGAVDVDDISDELDQAAEDSSVRAVMFDIDSPGGMVSGTPELAEKIAAFQKKTYAFSKGQIASAAYWIAASCDEIYATATADIGSIGVYIPWADVTGYYEKMGVSVELFKSGKYKGMGYPGTSLTKDQSKFLQARVDSIAQDFYSHVRQMRGNVADETMQGQTFSGRDAYKLNLVDELVGSKEAAIEQVS